ncbi:EcsC family protein, partial [bacterium]|nr:EcsC family protein [bacterium]
TAIMMRSIADIARSEGESLGDYDTKISCLEVFALGGPTDDDDATDAGYFAVRSALAKTVSEATAFIAKGGLVKESAPVLVRLIVQVAERFSVQVSTKAAAQAVPLIGAVGGGLVNTVFMNHFQDMARGHFVVRRLERKYGRELVQREYEAI